MLSPAHRLRRPADFSAVVRGGRRAGRRCLVVHLLTGPEPVEPGGGAPAGPLVGFVVSKAVGGSVVRNRVERRLRHLVRAHLLELPAGSRAVVRANPAAASATHEQLDRDLVGALERVTREVPGGPSRRSRG